MCLSVLSVCVICLLYRQAMGLSAVGKSVLNNYNIRKVFMCELFLCIAAFLNDFS